MIRTTVRSARCSVLLLSLAATPALAESSGAEAAPPPPGPQPTGQLDAFGLPTEVSFAPRAVAPVAPRADKAARPGKGRRRALVPASVEPVVDAPIEPAADSRGVEFVLGRPDRGSSYAPRADGEIKMVETTVTPAMVSAVVRANTAAVDYCMTRMPRAARQGTVGLVMTIEPGGAVSAARVNGAPRAQAFTTCLAAAARTWKFPVAEGAVEVEYPIVLNAR
ncbi:MAG: AgmX/PglI C-terminal domain-containing protein [Kofleriaceae bacterium]|nr:AgmX/PglI C-terminal domain-containing protein [Kofleriaceae bacterium]MCL4225837.1 AgmX/PglI C-terminal domain-containing protein [Myxococcales bacterium]